MGQFLLTVCAGTHIPELITAEAALPSYLRALGRTRSVRNAAVCAGAHTTVSRIDGSAANAPQHRPILIRMATYTVNRRAVAHARKLIEARQYVLDSDWGEAQPRADDENAYLERHSWDEYAAWHLGLTDGATDETKARYGFVFGDFRRVHRSGIIACHFRAAEWRHKEIELAAHDLLQVIDKRSG